MPLKLTQFAWMPLVVLLAAFGALWLEDPQEVFEPPRLLLALYVFFVLPVSLLVAVLAARSYLSAGDRGLLLLGAGALVWAASGLAGGALVYLGPNAVVTAHNTLVFLAGACHLSGVLVSRRSSTPAVGTGTRVAIAYGAALLAIALVAGLVVADLAPDFFVPGGGATPLRQLVLLSSLAMFLAAGLQLAAQGRVKAPAFVQWYGHGLLLIAAGLVVLVVQTSPGSAVSWVGRLAQLLGTLYMLLAILATWRDEGDRTGLALRDAEQRFHDLIDMAGDGIVLHEPRTATNPGHFLHANPAICQLLGYELDQMRAMSPVDLLTEQDLAQIPSDAQAIVRDGRLVHEKRLRTRDGRLVPVEINTRQFEFEGRPLILSVIHDVSQQQRLKEELVRLNAGLEQKVHLRTLQLTRANEVLRDNERRLRKLALHDDAVREQERKRIAREVHDELGQLLTALKMETSMMQTQFDQVPGLFDAAERMLGLIENTIGVVRQVTRNLRPPALDLGLAGALDWLAEDFSRRGHGRCSFTSRVADQVFDETLSTTVFRIAQEALTNVGRHAMAKSVQILLSSAADAEAKVLRLEISDDGCGFDVAGRLQAGGTYGLMGMRERVSALGGTLALDSRPGQGTRVTVELPLGRWR